MPDARFVETGRRSWTNWHRSFRQPVRDLFDLHNPDAPATPEGLRSTTAMIQGLLSRALAQDVRVRALGGGWSFSRAAATDGFVLNTKPLNWVFPISPASLEPDEAARAPELFLIQCGNQISEINRYLEVEEERSLRTTGASNGQTLMGAVSTGTHGSAIDVGAIQDHVLGMHLITSPDRHIWLEPASHPIVSQGFADALGAELVRNDALFAAAIVCFGSFGIVHSALIETTDRFVLEATRARMPFGAGLEQAITNLDFGGIPMPDPASRPYFFQVVFDPHTDGDPAYVTTMYKRPFPADHVIDYSESGGLGPGYELLGLFGAVSDAVPALTPLLVSQITASRLEPFDTPKIRTLGETFDFSSPRTKASGAALGVPLARSVDALEVIQQVHDAEGPAPLVFACRFVQRSKGTLAFTRFDPTCVIDLDGVASNRTQRFYRAVWQALRDAGIPFTQHWGKIVGLDATTVRSTYGGDVDAWLAARRTLLPDAAQRRLFSNAFLDTLGLAD